MSKSNKSIKIDARFFNPKSVAIVGASNQKEKIGNIVAHNFLKKEFSGKVWMVNPNSKKVLGRTSYPTVLDLPDTPDLVIIAIPAKFCLQVMKECGEAGVKNVVMFTAGFKEIGEKGKQIEEEIKSIAEQYTIALLGPNCLGFSSNNGTINATFSRVPKQKGSLQVLSQSGAIVSALFDRSSRSNVGINSCTTLGNKTVLNENHFLEYRLENSPSGIEGNGHNGSNGHTGSIGLYLESITDGQKFHKLAHRLSKSRPLFLLKPGKSQAAKKAMQSHTGSIAGDDQILNALCKQTGIIRCKTIEDFFDMAMITSWSPAPQGNNVGLLTNAGGPGVISTDLLEQYDLTVAELSKNTQEKISKHLPRAASVKDPVDILGDAPANRYKNALETLLQTNHELDAILILLTPQLMTEIDKTAQAISAIKNKHNIPIVCAFIGHNQINAGIEILHTHNIPCFTYPERAIRALSHYHKRQQRRQSAPQKPTRWKKPKSLKDGLQDLNKLALNNNFSNLLTKFGLTLPESQIIDSKKSAKKAYKKLDKPLVMKIIGLPHKTEHQGVITDITNKKQAKKSYTKLKKIIKKLKNNRNQNKQNNSLQIQVQQQITSGVEAILGYKFDENYGHTLLFGRGGTETELYNDHETLLAPVSKKVIKEMIQASSIFPLLDGWRGSKKKDIDQLVHTVWKFMMSAIRMQKQSDNAIKSIEINPLIITKNISWCVDNKIFLRKIGQKTR